MEKELHDTAVTVLSRVWGSVCPTAETPKCSLGIHNPWRSESSGVPSRAGSRCTEESRGRQQGKGMAGLGVAAAPVPAGAVITKPTASLGVGLAQTPPTPDPVSGLHWPRVQSCTLPSTFMQKASTPHVFPLYLRPCEILAEVDGFCPEYTI